MAKKIDAALAKKLKDLKITAKTEDEARKKLLAILEKEGVEGMDDEDTDTLIDMVDSFVDNDVEEPDETDEVEEEVDETEETEEEPEEEEAEVDDAEDETEEVDDEEKEADELAEEVAAEEPDETDEVEEEVDETEETEEEPKEEEKKPAKKAAPAKKKTEEKPAKKETTKKTTKTTEKPAKKEAKTEEKKTSKRGKRLDPKNVAADRKEFDALKKLFGEGYNYAWLSSFGVTIKHVGKNGSRGIVTIENCTKLDDGNVRCNLYLLTMAKQTDKLDELGLDYGICWSGAPYMKGIILDEIVEVLEKLYDDITSFVTTVDKRLGDNRKKMEENLKSSGKKTTKTTTTKKAKK